MLPVFSFGTRSCCAYCGDPANSKDHVIAVSFQTVMSRRTISHGPWCWCCSDCNCHLSNRYFETFKDRCIWARDRLAKKAKPVLWHQWEIDSLDATIASFVRKDTFKRQWMSLRADFYEGHDFYLNLESLLWQVPQSANEFLSSYFCSILADIAQIYHTKFANSWDSNE